MYSFDHFVHRWCAVLAVTGQEQFVGDFPQGRFRGRVIIPEAEPVGNYLRLRTLSNEVVILIEGEKLELEGFPETIKTFEENTGIHFGLVWCNVLAQPVANELSRRSGIIAPRKAVVP